MHQIISCALNGQTLCVGSAGKTGTIHVTHYPRRIQEENHFILSKDTEKGCDQVSKLLHASSVRSTPGGDTCSRHSYHLVLEGAAGAMTCHTNETATRVRLAKEQAQRAGKRGESACKVGLPHSATQQDPLRVHAWGNARMSARTCPRMVTAALLLTPPNRSAAGPTGVEWINCGTCR